MYSSLDNPTYEEWLAEYNRLLDQLRHHARVYNMKLYGCIQTEDTFMMKYYCLKLLEANKRLEFAEVGLSNVKHEVDMKKEWGQFLKENESEIRKEVEKYGRKERNNNEL